MASLAVAISGPFGSYANLTFAERLLYWPPLLAFAVLVSTAIRAFVHGTLGLSGTISSALVNAGLIAAILTLPLYFAIRLLFDPIFGGVAGGLDIFLVVFSVSVGVCALRIAMDAEPMAKAEPVPLVARPAADPPRLLRRFEPEMRGRIWAMTVRDHYVDVQTDRGKVSLLMRFSDAMDEVQPVQGAQVHRSHWVAWEGVGSVCREGGKMFLHLKNGSQIPVSRNHRGKVDARFPPIDVQVKDAAA